MLQYHELQVSLYAPWYHVELGKKTWGHTMSNLFKMINVKDHEDGSFTIEWDENTRKKASSTTGRKKTSSSSSLVRQGENAKESREESQEDYYNSESEGKDFDERYDQYIQATNEETFGIEGDELLED